MDINQKEILLLDGLNCSNCAAKIEREINDIEGVNATLNFITKTLTIEHNANNVDVITKAENIIHSHEPSVRVSRTQCETLPKKESVNVFGIEGILGLKQITALLGTVIFLIAVIFSLPETIEAIMYVVGYLFLGGEILFKAAKSTKKGQVFNENFLMSIATLGAMAIGEYTEGVAVMLFYQIGEFLQDISLERSRKSISDLVDIRPDYANLVSGNSINKVSPSQVSVGDIIVVKPGERIPLDGIITDGNSSLDMSSLTGEPIPKTVHAKDEVFSGSVNMEGLLTIKVTKVFHDSTAAKILDLVQNSATKKASTEKFITRFAKWYTPAVVIIAAFMAIFPPLIITAANRGVFGAELITALGLNFYSNISFSTLFSDWVYRALIFLVVSCPCALVISIPLGFFGGIGLASKNGILVKGGNYLEGLTLLDSVVFDKTGTLTKGEFEVSQVLPFNGVNEHELLKIASAAEKYSNHPIAKSIVKACPNSSDIEIEAHSEIPGFGVIAKLNEREILVGNKNLMDKEQIQTVNPEKPGSVVYVAVDKEFIGSIIVSDSEKVDAAKSIEKLKNMGIRTAMLTGDLTENANGIAKRLGIDEVYSELLPQHKVEIFGNLVSKKNVKRKIAYVGDGMNDAPVLARADIGIAMGGLGADAAIEAADIVIMNDEPAKLLTAIKIAYDTKKIIYQNIFFAFAVKIIVMFLSAGGLATMWEAVFADVGVALIAVINAMRLISRRSH